MSDTFVWYAEPVPAVDAHPDLVIGVGCYEDDDDRLGLAIGNNLVLLTFAEALELANLIKAIEANDPA